MRTVKEVRPAVVLKHDMFSLLVDSSGSAPRQGPGYGQRNSLVCVEALQDRLRRAVLLPYFEGKVSRSISAHGLGGCSGKSSLFSRCVLTALLSSLNASAKTKQY
jgi:hypothetical protein